MLVIALAPTVAGGIGLLYVPSAVLVGVRLPRSRTTVTA